MSDANCDALLHDGGPACGAPFRKQSVAEQMCCEFRCERGHLRDELYLAARSLGPFAPKRSPAVERENIPSFRWDAQEQCYVRIASDDEVARSVADDMRRWHAKGRPGW